MATTKRMFSNDIVGSDAFIEMPTTSQALYFHLGMRCDDDGFVNPNVTMRMTGANKNDLDILIGKRFLIAFKNGVVVIKHHRINNNWDSRDCKRTLYTEELRQLFIKENNSYTLDETQGVEVEQKYLANKGNSNKKTLSDGKPTELRRQNRIEENRIEENRIVKNKFVELEIPEKVNKESWIEWENYRKERRLATYKDTSKKKQWNFLSGYDLETQKMIIDTSIANNWQGLFPPKQKYNSKPVQNVLKSDQTEQILKSTQNKIIQA